MMKTIETRLFVPAACPARVFFKNIPLSKTEGAGKTGRPMRPQPRVQSKKAHELVTTGHRIDPAFPAQWF
jgi:hypothetical protein